MQTRAALCTVLSFGLAACNDAAPASVDEQAAATREIIGGFEATSASLNAIGTVGLYDDYLHIYSYWCTATLIAPTQVITAKHCVMSTEDATYGTPLLNLMPMHFAVGPDVKAPVKIYEVIAADLSPVDEGGFIKVGNDVAVLHLREKVEGVKPIAVADGSLGTAALGQRFASVGFGAKTTEEAMYGMYSGIRSAAAVTLHAVEGQSYVALFGTWQKYYDFMVWLYGQDTVDIAIDIITGWWADTAILAGYEVHAGGQANDGQLCIGDDGAPLIGREDGVQKVFGVASNSWFSQSSACDDGTFFAVIGPKTREMLEGASQFVDPCGEVTVQGLCDGSIARRCTDTLEGPRSLSEIDCALLDQTCAFVDGRAGCVDEGGARPAPRPTKRLSGDDIRKQLEASRARLLRR